MSNSLTKFVDKLSSYQLFNYLFPGIIFNYVVEQTMSFRIAQNDILYRFFVYYITGMVLSRIGSIIIEPIYKKWCWVVYAKYKNYLKAEEKDPKLNLLLLENNTYRTLIATFFCLLVLYGIDQIEWLHDKYDSNIATILYLGFFLFLFSVSFHKQTDFIRKRTHRNLELKDEEQVNELKDNQKKIRIWKQIL